VSNRFDLVVSSCVAQGFELVRLGAAKAVVAVLSLEPITGARELE
jgi:hypothetical protein